MEVMVAVAVGSLVILTAVTLARAVDDGNRAAVRTASRAAGHAIAEVTVNDLLYHAADGRDSTERFVGTPDSARFRSQCAAAPGWLEPCSIRLRFRRAGVDSVQLVSSLGDTAVVATGGRESQLIYMRNSPPVLEWASAWVGESTVPRAIALVSSGDTIIFRVAAHP